MAAAMDFEIAGAHMRGECDHMLKDARSEFKGNLNFAAYRQARHPTYLGVMGKNNYGKSYGNDSSNVQAVLNGPSYWSRVYYRSKDGDLVANNQGEEKEKPGLRKSASEPGLSSSPTKLLGYALVRDRMHDMVQGGNAKPEFPKRGPGERLDFFNTLVKKYDMKSGDAKVPWNIDTLGHRSSPNELKFISSCYFRKDSDYLLNSNIRR